MVRNILILSAIFFAFVGCKPPAPEANPTKPETTPTNPDKGQQAKSAAMSEDVIQSWVKAGAMVEVSGITNDGIATFSKGFGADYPSSIPCFNIKKWKDGMTKDLPAPEVPFALDLYNAGITDAGLDELAKFPTLSRINLLECEFTLAGLKKLIDKHPDITVMKLGGSAYSMAIKDDWLKEIGRCEKLTHLHLNLGSVQSNVTPEGFKELAKLKKLESLNAKISDDGIKELVNVNSLLHLSTNSRATDECMADLAKMKQLKSLTFKSCDIRDTGIARIATLENLEHLDLSRCKITDKSIDTIVTLKKLQEIRLIASEVTDAGLKKLVTLPELKRLYLDSNEKISKNAIEEMKKSLPKLEVRSY